MLPRHPDPIRKRRSVLWLITVGLVIACLTVVFIVGVFRSPGSNSQTESGAKTETRRVDAVDKQNEQVKPPDSEVSPDSPDASRSLNAAFPGRLVHSAPVADSEQESFPFPEGYDPVTTWYADAPYLSVKDRFEELLASDVNDINNLVAAYELASYLGSTHFADWSRQGTRTLPGSDQIEKALVLERHIIENGPTHELLACRAKARYARHHYHLRQDREAMVATYMEILNVPVAEVVDSAHPRNNTVLSLSERQALAAEAVKPTREGLAPHGTVNEALKAQTRVQFAFVKCKNSTRKNLIYHCHRLRSDVERIETLSRIIAGCRERDPDIVPLAERFRERLVNQILNESTHDASQHLLSGAR